MGEDRRGAFGAWLAARHAQLDELAVAEQRAARARVRKRAPVEAALGEEHLALGETLLARRGANGVGRLERKQRLVAVDHVKRRERGLPQVRLELLGADQHRDARARA